MPLQYEEFTPCLTWWKNHEENDSAWKISAADVLKYEENGTLISVNLDFKNPHGKADFEHLPPEQLADDIIKKEQQIVEIMTEIKQALRGVEQ